MSLNTLRYAIFVILVFLVECAFPPEPPCIVKAYVASTLRGSQPGSEHIADPGSEFLLVQARFPSNVVYQGDVFRPEDSTLITNTGEELRGLYQFDQCDTRCVGATYVGKDTSTMTDLKEITVVFIVPSTALHGGNLSFRLRQQRALPIAITP